MMRCRSVLASRSPPSCRTKSAQRGSQCPQDSTAFTWRNSRTAIGISVSNQPTRTLRVSGPGMLKMSPTGRQFSEAASRRDLVQFYAQYRTEHDVPAPVSGVVQFINHGGKIAQTFPLIVGHDDASVSRATTLYVNLRWDQSDTKYLGKNTAKFVVKIGATQFTSTGEFTLTP